MNFSSLNVSSENGEIPIHTEPLEALCEEVYSGEEVSRDQVVDLIFCSSQTIQRLNNSYRSKDSVTDVLSFPFGDEDYLGEIYICTERAIEQAKEYNFTLEEECSRLFVHGLFHLLGYDHMSEEERHIMESKEQSYYIVN